MKKAMIMTLTFATLSTIGLMTGNALAEECTSHSVTATGSSAGSIAKFRKRRAKRRAVRAWEKKVTSNFGGKFANFKNASDNSITFGSTRRGNTSATAKGTVTVCR